MHVLAAEVEALLRLPVAIGIAQQDDLVRRSLTGATLLNIQPITMPVNPLGLLPAGALVSVTSTSPLGRVSMVRG